MKNIMNYLSLLEQNNNQAWFHEHKAQYQEANGQFELLIAELMTELRKTDETIPFVSPRELTFKLQRDTRFSHDKSPYNTSFRAHIGPSGKLPIPVGHYIMIRPGNRSFLGGGLFADMFKDATQRVRDYIAEHGEEWMDILSRDAFTKHFTVQGTSLKKVPQGYDPNHPQAEYLKNKSWYLEYAIPDDVICKDGFVAYAADVFIQMRAFNAFLNRALDGYQMPSR